MRAHLASTMLCNYIIFVHQFHTKDEFEELLSDSYTLLICAIAPKQVHGEASALPSAEAS